MIQCSGGQTNPITLFITIKLDYWVANIIKIYLKYIFMLHGIIKEIILDKELKFISKFWKGLFKGFGTNLNFSTTNHPQTDGWTKRVNQVIEYMLRMYVMDKSSKWEDCLNLV
jgi:hypothetical protein